MKLYLGGLGHGQDVLAEKETGLKPEIVNCEEALSAKAINNYEDFRNPLDADKYWRDQYGDRTSKKDSESDNNEYGNRRT